MTTKLLGACMTAVLTTLLAACSSEVSGESGANQADELQDTARCAPSAAPGGAACQKTCRDQGGLLFWDAKADGGHGAYDCVYGTDACWASAAEGLFLRAAPYSSAPKLAATASPCTELLVRYRAGEAFENPASTDDIGAIPAGTTVTRVVAAGGECEPFDYLEEGGSAPSERRCWRKVMRIPLVNGQYATDRHAWSVGFVRSGLLACGAVKAVGSAANAADAVCESKALAMLPDQVVDCSSIGFSAPTPVDKGGVSSAYETSHEGFKVKGHVVDGRHYRFAASWTVGGTNHNFARTIDSRGEYCFFGEGAPGFAGFFVSAQEVDASGNPIGAPKAIAP